jgi:5-methylcytosine-specific restriction endonuclease McrA
MQATRLENLSDDDLLLRLRKACAESNAVTMRIVELLIETEDRRLYVADACTSMFDYCVRRLNMSEGAAYLRLAAARLVRKFPTLGPRLESGAIHLSALVLLRDHLTADNVDELADAVRGMSKRRVTEYLASREGPIAASPAPTTLRKLPKIKKANEIAAAPQREIELVNEMQYRLGLTVTREERDELLYVRDLMMHRNPSGDLKVVVLKAVRALREQLEREIHAKTDRPRRPSLAKTKGVSRRARREVFARDGHRCTYTNKDGERCPATKLLELDHIDSPHHGGSNEPDNLRVRCRAHNLWHAENVFGKEYVRKKIANSSQLKSNLVAAKRRVRAKVS